MLEKSSMEIISFLLIFATTKSFKNLGHKNSVGLIILSLQSQTICRCVTAKSTCLIILYKAWASNCCATMISKIFRTHELS